MAISVTEVRPGSTVEYNGQIFKCIEYNHIKWAQQARVRLRLKNLRSGAITEQTFNVDDAMERAHIEYKQMQFLYADGETYHFMDEKNFEQIALDKVHMGDSAKYIKEGATVTIMFYGEEPLDIDLPTSVNLKVAETAPGFKGDTVSGGKPAKLETGLVVQVPFFMNPGDTIKVDTRSGEYLGRA